MPFELKGIRKRFGPTLALAGVDFQVGGGEIHALIGENGAGKSTLMRVLSGVLRADAGSMVLDGKSYTPTSPDAGRRAGVSMIYQELMLAPYLSADENILLGREPAVLGWISGSSRREIARKALAQLGHESLPLRVPVGQLTVAEQQIVEIARALVGRPRVLILDEPTSSLTRTDTVRLFEVLRRLRDQGVSIVYISHFLEECREIADRYTVLRDGRTVGTGSIAETDLPSIIKLMVGREVSEVYPRRQSRSGPAILTVDELSGSAKPDGVSFALARGEILGLAGLVGAGRTETVRTLFGLDRLKSGRLNLKGVIVARPEPRSQIRRGVGFLSEDRKGEGLMGRQSVADNLVLSDFRLVSAGGFLSSGKLKRVADQWVDRLGIVVRDSRQPVGDLSGGNQQKVLLARLLHQEADILLLDEPTRGVDVGSKIEIYRLIGDLASKGCAILFVSSYLPELLGVCDRIGVMHRGRLAQIRPTADWTEHEIIRIAAGGTG
ncbi:MAG: sugar ABC transporter ATP-binding protein [Opitutaceae bacterium]